MLPQAKRRLRAAPRNSCHFQEVDMRKILAVLALLILATASVAAAEEHLVRSDLVAVGDSGVTGMVDIEQLPAGGTNIHVVAQGLIPGNTYVSLYYENHTCELEPYAEDDVIGTYTANAAGVGVTHGKLEDDLDEINSVSVRRASDFALLACADVHPGG